MRLILLYCFLKLSRRQPWRVGESSPFNPRLALANLADHERRHAVFHQAALDALGEVAADDHDEADAVVEDGVHFLLLELADLLEPGEHRRHGPAAALEEDALARRQDARDVARQALAG